MIQLKDNKVTSQEVMDETTKIIVKLANEIETHQEQRIKLTVKESFKINLEKVAIKQFEEKAALCETHKAHQLQQAEVPKVIELNEKGGDRKYMRGSLDLVATELLRERKAYVLCQVLRNEQDEEYTENIVVDGACMRTPEEDIKWAEEQAELEAAAAKGNKKAPPAKKK